MKWLKYKDISYRLLLADKDVVAGIYPLKCENWPDEGVPAGTTQADFERMYTAYTVNTGDKNENGEIVLRVDEEGFMKVDDAPTGFMVIKRSVFEKMMAAYPELNYISDSDYKREDKGLHYRFFDCMVDPESKRYLSEDYIGNHIHLDTGLGQGHGGILVGAEPHRGFSDETFSRR